MSRLQELVLRVPQSAVDEVSDTLMDALGALSVSVEDADAGTEAERALFGEPGMPAPQPGWERSTLKALFDDETAAEQAATALLAHGNEAWQVQLQALQPVPEEDWVRLTQAQFTPIEVTPTFWIVPSWHTAPPQAQRVLRLDPGLAFGTGSHPTTRMCLRWIAGTPMAGLRVLDYGCGSGILAIAAALHGAVPVDALDIDPAAVSATRSNASDNGAALRRIGLPDAVDGPYDIVLANILATPLKLLAPLLSGLLAPGGQLVLAGLLTRQREELVATYAPRVALHEADSEDGWSLLAGRLVT